MIDFIYNNYIGNICSTVLDSDDPNAKLKSIDSIDRDLFYISKFVQIVWNGGIDAYLSGYCGDDLLNVKEACVRFDLIYLLNKIDVFLTLIPELGRVHDNHQREYEKILVERGVNGFAVIYEFEIGDEVNEHLNLCLKHLLKDENEKFAEIVLR